MSRQYQVFSDEGAGAGRRRSNDSDHEVLIPAEVQLGLSDFLAMIKAGRGWYRGSAQYRPLEAG